jgi:hypothetical protein
MKQFELIIPDQSEIYIGIYLDWKIYGESQIFIVVIFLTVLYCNNVYN